jgi:hypothetical protein
MGFASFLSSPMRRRSNSRPAKPNPHRLIVWCAVAFAVLLLLLRMFVYVRGRR